MAFGACFGLKRELFGLSSKGARNWILTAGLSENYSLPPYMAVGQKQVPNMEPGNLDYNLRSPGLILTHTHILSRTPIKRITPRPAAPPRRAAAEAAAGAKPADADAGDAGDAGVTEAAGAGADFRDLAEAERRRGAGLKGAVPRAGPIDHVSHYQNQTNGINMVYYPNTCKE